MRGAGRSGRERSCLLFGFLWGFHAEYRQPGGEGALLPVAGSPKMHTQPQMFQQSSVGGPLLKEDSLTPLFGGILAQP